MVSFTVNREVMTRVETKHMKFLEARIKCKTEIQSQ